MSDRVVMIPQIEKIVVDLEFVIDGVNRERCVGRMILDYADGNVLILREGRLYIQKSMYKVRVQVG